MVKPREVWHAKCLSCDETCPVDLDEDWTRQGWGYLPAEALTRYVDWRREHGACYVVIEEKSGD